MKYTTAVAVTLLSSMIYLFFFTNQVSSLPKTGEYDTVDINPVSSVFNTADSISQLLTGQGDSLLFKRSPQYQRIVTPPPRTESCNRCNYCGSGRCRGNGNCC